MRSIADVLLVASLVLIAPAAAQARGGGSHHTQHSDLTVTKSTDKASTKMMSRDAGSGQATGKRTHKPVHSDLTVTKTSDKASAKIMSRSKKTRATPDKTEAGSENVK